VAGKAPPAGHVVRYPELAKSLEVLAKGGADAFYRGPFTRRLVQGVQKLGGIWTVDDLANYRPVEREPIITAYQGVRIGKRAAAVLGRGLLASVLTSSRVTTSRASIRRRASTSW